MYLYILVFKVLYLWVHAMKAPFWKLEGVASGTHYTPTLRNSSDSHSTQPKIVKVPSTTCACRNKAKHHHGSVHASTSAYILVCMHLQNMIQLTPSLC